jgi:hypothetical protein
MRLKSNSPLRKLLTGPLSIIVEPCWIKVIPFPLLRLGLLPLVGSTDPYNREFLVIVWLKSLVALTILSLTEE